MRSNESQTDADEAPERVFGSDGHLDEGAAHAFIDGALPDEDAARVVLHLRECAPCAALVAEARGLAAAAAGVVRHLDDGRGARLVLGAAPVAARGRRRFALPRAAGRAAAAALLAAGVGGSAYLASRRSPAVSRGAGAEAASALAAAAPASPAGGQSAPSPAAALPRMVADAAGRSAARKQSPATPAPAAPTDSAASISAPAPEHVVVGDVRDATSRPLAAATVVVAGTSIGATTDDSGRFVLRGVPAGTFTLRARRVGFGPGTTAVAVGPADTTRAGLRLSAQALSLEQVVVTGRDVVPPTVGSPISGSPISGSPAAGMVRSDRRARRTRLVPADSGACFAVARVPSEALRARAEGAVPVPSPVRLGAADAVRAGGRVRGSWALVGTDSLRVTWYDPTLPALALRRDGAGWVGGGLRLTPATEEGCGPP